VAHCVEPNSLLTNILVKMEPDYSRSVARSSQAGLRRFLENLARAGRYWESLAMQSLPNLSRH
jgi:hypothetical protein